MSDEKLLTLPDGRVIAYAESGDRTSSTVVMFFSGVFSVGSAKRTSTVLLEKGVHFVAPTLPGWGNSSSTARGQTYGSSLAADMSLLIDHLRPDRTDFKLYIGGGSYGTVAAQIIYRASYDVFPCGRNVAGLLLLGPFPPFHLDENYAKCMTWENWVAVGPPHKWIPFQLLARLMKVVIQSKLKNLESAEKFAHEFLFKKMDSKDLEIFAQWREKKGVEEGQLEREMAEGMIASVSKSWDGFFGIGDVLHSNWATSNREELNNEQDYPPVLVCTADGDKSTPIEWGKYLVESYPNARLKTFKGDHISAMFYLDEIWEEFMTL